MYYLFFYRLFIRPPSPEMFSGFSFDHYNIITLHYIEQAIEYLIKNTTQSHDNRMMLLHRVK